MLIRVSVGQVEDKLWTITTKAKTIIETSIASNWALLACIGSGVFPFTYGTICWDFAELREFYPNSSIEATLLLTSSIVKQISHKIDLVERD